MVKELRKALPVHHTETSEGAWDGPANEARLKNDETSSYYKKAYAWQDPDKDADTKAAYKFIHHEVDGEGNIGPANIKACRTGIGVLNGGRGGTTISDEDRQGVYDHLAAHLKDAGLEPPELKDRGRQESRIERRTFPFEVRVADDGDSDPIIEGHAAVFDQLSEEMWGFREKIEPGAFAETIKKADVRALFNHDPNFVLGRNKSGTLSLSEDDQGLFTKIWPPNTALVNDLVLTPMKRGDISQMSFGFKVLGQRWETIEGIDVRIITEVELFDVSVVTFPAYPQTEAQVRSVLAKAGLNYDAIADVLIRAQRGQDLTENDRDIINASIQKLQSYLPPETVRGQKEGDDANDKPQGRLILLRKRLEVAEKLIV